MSKQKRLTKEAFSEIYLEHYDDMKRFAAKRFFAAGRTDPHQVLDAVQETFRILCEKPESYQSGGGDAAHRDLEHLAHSPHQTAFQGVLGGLPGQWAFLCGSLFFPAVQPGLFVPKGAEYPLL